ncbi:MAG: hypothetical protein PHF60_04600, partial [Candidatus ainarchaeum sp.]|nr:hypothetical protein [Candidatus ainarchaeum sp.]
MAKQKTAPEQAAQDVMAAQRELMGATGAAALVPKPGMPGGVAERAALNQANARADAALADLMKGSASPINRVLPTDQKTMSRMVEERFTPEERKRYQKEIEAIDKLAQDAALARKQGDAAKAASYEGSARAAFETLDYVDKVSKKLDAMGDREMPQVVRGAFWDMTREGASGEETMLMRQRAAIALRSAGAYAEYHDTITAANAPLAAWIGASLHDNVIALWREGLSADTAERLSARLDLMETKLANFRSFETEPKVGGYSDDDLKLSERERLSESISAMQAITRNIRERPDYDQMAPEIRQRADTAAWFFERADQLEKTSARYSEIALAYFKSGEFLFLNLDKEAPAGSAAASVFAMAPQMMERDTSGQFKTFAGMDKAAKEMGQALTAASLENGVQSNELNVESLRKEMADGRTYPQEERRSISRNLDKIHELDQKASAALADGRLEEAGRMLLLSKSLLVATSQYADAVAERRGMKLPVAKARAQFEELTARADAAIVRMKDGLGRMAALDPGMAFADLTGRVETIGEANSAAFNDVQAARTDAELQRFDASREGYA